MIEMTYGQLSSMGFKQTMQKLVNTPMPIKVAYQVKKLADAMNACASKIHEEYNKDILSQVAQKDAKGEIQVDKQGPVVKDEDREQLEKLEAEFSKRVVKIDRAKLSLSDLTLQLSAGELTSLEPILQDPELGQPAQVLPLK